MAGNTVSRRISIYIDQATAERALDKLNKKGKDLVISIQAGQRAGKDMTKQMEALAKTRDEIGKIKDVLDGKVNPSLKQTQAAVKRLENELANMGDNAPGYAEKFKEFEKAAQYLAHLKGNIDAVKRGLKDDGGTSSSWLSRMGDQVKAYAAGNLLGGGIANVLDSVWQKAKDVFTGNMKLSESFSDVAMTTGMTRKEVRGLNDELSKINTRTPEAELLKIAKIGGQYNVAKDELKDFVEEVNKASVVLGNEFGGGVEQVTDEMSLLRNVFSDIKTDKIADDISHISNAVVTLAQEGAATGPVITDMAKRLSPLISTAKLSSGAILGMGAAMQEMAINPERGATAMIRLFDEMTSNIAAFAKVAGMSTNEFRQLIKDDAMGGFVKVLDGFKKGGSNVVELNGLLKELEVNGIGAKEVLVKMSADTGLLTERTRLATEALTNTNAITQQYAEKSDNAMGITEKWGRAMSNYFINSKLVEGLTQIATYFGIVTGVVDETQVALKEFLDTKKEVEALEQSMVPLIARYEELNEKAEQLGGLSKLSKEEQKELRAAIQTIGDTIPYAVTQFDDYGKAISVSTDRAREFIKIQKDAMAEMNRMKLMEASQRLETLKADKAEEERKMRQAQAQYRNLKAKGETGHQLEEKSGQIYDLAQNVNDLAGQIQSVSAAITVMGGSAEGTTKESKDMLDTVTFGFNRSNQDMAKSGSEAVEAVGSTAKQVMQDVTDVTLMSGEDIRAELQKLKKEASGTANDIARIKDLSLEMKKRTGTGGFRSSNPEKNKKEQAEKTMARLMAEIQNLGAETQAKLADLNKGDGQDHSKEIQQLAERYERVRSALESLPKKYVDVAAAMAGLNAEEKKALAVLMQKQERERGDAEYKQSLQHLKDFYNQQKQLNDEAFTGGTIDKKKYETNLRQIEKDEAEDRVTIIKDYAPVVKQAQADLEGATTAALQKGVSERKRLVEDEGNDRIYKAQRALVTTREGTKAETEARIELLNAQFAKETELIDKNSELYQLKFAELGKSIDATIVQGWTKKVNSIIQGLQMAQDVLGSYFAMLNEGENQQLAKEKTLNDQKKAKFDKMLKDKTISQEEYNKKVFALDEAYRKKDNAARKKQFQRNKAAAYAEAVINAAQAITQIWATYAAAPYVAAALTAIAAAATGFKIATISKQKFQEYEKGGRAPQMGKGGRPSGPSHAAGGIKMYDNQGNVIGEMEGGEPILSNATYRNNKPAVDALLNASMYGGGRAVDMSHLYQMPKRIDYGRATETVHYSRSYGSALRQAQGDNGGGSFDSAQDDNGLAGAVMELNGLLKKGIKAYTVLKDHNEKQNELDRLKKLGSFL